jgi:hypothetical protein
MTIILEKEYLKRMSPQNAKKLYTVSCNHRPKICNPLERHTEIYSFFETSASTNSHN